MVITPSGGGQCWLADDWFQREGWESRAIDDQYRLTGSVEINEVCIYPGRRENSFLERAPKRVDGSHQARDIAGSDLEWFPIIGLRAVGAPVMAYYEGAVFEVSVHLSLVLAIAAYSRRIRRLS